MNILHYMILRYLMRRHQENEKKIYQPEIETFFGGLPNEMLSTLEFSINKYNLYAHISKLAEKGLVKVERHGLNQVQITKKGLLILKDLEECLKD